MDAKIPLKWSGGAPQETVVATLLSTSREACDMCFARITPGPGCWFTIHSAACVLLCSLEETTVAVCCAVFSRRLRSSSVFSCEVNGQLFDLAVARGPAARSENLDVCQTSDDAIQNVGFIGRQLTIGTRGGDLALVWVPDGAVPPMTVVVGQSVKSLARPCSPAPCVWGFSPEANLCVGLTAQGVWMHRLGDDSSPLSIWKPLTLDHAEFSSVAAAQCVPNGEVTLATCDPVEHRVVIFVTDSTLSSLPHQREYALLDTSVDVAQFPQSSPQCYLHAMSNEPGHVLAAVYPDSVIFATVYAGEITCSAALRNELNLTFESGCWITHTSTRTREEFELAVTRSDGACLLYVVVAEKGQRRISELVLNGYVILAHPNCARITVPQNKGGPPANSIWLSISSTEDVMFNVAGAVVRHDSDEQHVACTVANHVHASPVSGVLLLEVVVSQGEFGLLALLSSGECLLATQKGRTMVGQEDPGDAQTVTSIYAFDVAGEQHGVMGHRDGSVRFFSDGVLKAHLRMAHTGPVDQLVRLPAYEFGSGDVDDALVMSVCTQMGTVCLHSGTTGDVVCILRSPSRPLTGCFLDRKSQYMRTFSGDAGNLWHIPTCRLERTFTCAHQGLEKGLDNLLHVHSSSLLRVEGTRFLGEMHYTVHLGVSALIADDTPAGGSGGDRSEPHSRDFAAALSLLLQSGLLDSTRSDTGCRDGLISLTQAGLNGCALQVPLDSLSLTPARGGGGETARWGLFAMLCSLITKRGDPRVTAAAYQLAIETLNGATRGRSSKEQACALLSFYSVFFDNDPDHVPSAMAQFGLQSLVSSIRIPDVLSFFDPLEGENWHLLRTVAASTSRQDGGALSVRLQHALVLTVLGYHCEYSVGDSGSSLLATAQQSRLEEAVLTVVKAFERSQQQQQTQSSQLRTPATAHDDATTFTTSETLIRGLIPIAAGLPFVHRFVNERELVGMLCCAAFSPTAQPPASGDKTSSTYDLALQCAASHNVSRFLSDMIRPLYSQKPAWRVRIVVFLTNLVRNYPFAAYQAAAELIEFAVGALDPHAPERDEKALSTAAVAEMLRVTVATLPNVSFQQSLQQLAVGHKSGEVKVYSLRTAALVTTIAAQKEAIMAVSYSSNSASYDIAVIPESMKMMRVWRAAKPGSGLTSFLVGYAVHFKCINEVELPAAKISDASKPVLLPLSTLKWLSPQCIWFTSPWHGKLELSLGHLPQQ